MFLGKSLNWLPGLIEKEKQKIFKKFGKIERYGKGMDIDTEGSGLGYIYQEKLFDYMGGKFSLNQKEEIKVRNL